MKTLLITRPKEDAEELAAILTQKGFHCLCEPMLTVETLKDASAILAEALARQPQAILVTSKHAIEQWARLTRKRNLSVFTVGKASADCAAHLGFTRIIDGGGTAKALIAAVRSRLKPEDGGLLYLRGEHVSTDLARALKRSRFAIESVTLYQARAAHQLSESLRKSLEAGGIDGVFFFSARSAAIYVKLVGNAFSHKHMTALCMSEAIAAKARAIGWRHVHVAAAPDRASMIALADTLAA